MESLLPEKIAAARLKLSKQRPYLSAALWAFIPIKSEQVPTMAVDKFWRLYFNPERYKEWSVDEIQAVLYHELLHLLRSHHFRAKLKNTDHYLWNLAGDMEINDDIKGEGLALPEGCIYPSTFKEKDTGHPLPDGLLAEEYYDRLPIEEQDCTCGQGQQGDGDQQGQSGSGDSQGQGQGEGSVSCPVHGDHGNPIPGGSGSGAQSSPWEVSGDKARRIDASEGRIIQRSVAKQIQDAVDKSRGDVPGHMARWAKENLSPQVPWRQVLKGAIRRVVADVAGSVDYVRTRPNRRQHAYGRIVMPAMRRPTPTVAMCIDTSGSMSDKELSMGKAEVDGVLRSMGMRDITVFTVDAAVHGKKKVSSAGQVKFEGGGGTDMSLGIQAAQDLKPRPDVLVVFSDCYTPWGEPPKNKMKVIVVSTTEESGPDWARTIHIDQKK